MRVDCLLSDLPELSRGKGNKIINIPSSRLQSREEFVVDFAVIPEGGSLVVHSGKRYLVISQKTFYRGERGRFAPRFSNRLEAE